MAAENPRAPTRKQFKKIFGDDKRLIKAFEQLFEFVPDEIDASIEELFEGQYSWLGPAINLVTGKAFEQGKEIRDVVEEIAADRIAIAAVSGNLGEFKKVVADQAAFIAELIATVGRLNGNLGEFKKVVSDQAAFIAELVSAVARLNGKLGEATKPRTVKSKSSAYQILNSDRGVIANATSAAFPVTLPDAEKSRDLDFFVQKADSSANDVTVDGFGSQTINGDPDVTISVQYDAPSFISDGTNWIEI